MDVEELVGPSALQPEVFEIITYALKLAWTAETYNVHSWMVLLGLLKKESYTAVQVRFAVEQQQQLQQCIGTDLGGSAVFHVCALECTAMLQAMISIQP
jgi:hypothetical protein